MTTLITGATGFVGSAVLRRLVGDGHAVRALVRPGSDRTNLDGVRADLVTGDVCDRASLDRAVAGCDAVVHAAADYRLWVARPEEMYAANVEGTCNVMLAAAAAGVTRIVYTSSVATLGLTADGTAADEDTPSTLDQMIGHYKRSKFLAEAEVRKLAADDGLPVVIVNPSAPIGPRDVRPTPTGRMVIEAASGRMPAYVDTGLNVVHVDDVAEGHLRALERGRTGERYILGGTNMTLREILCEIAAITGRPPPRIRLPHALVLPVAYVAEAVVRMRGRGEPLTTVDSVRMSRKRMFFSSDKARRELGWAPREARLALEDAVAWFRRHGYCP